MQNAWLFTLSSTRRTAVCGPACTVVREGRTGDCLPLSRLLPLAGCADHSRIPGEPPDYRGNPQAGITVDPPWCPSLTFSIGGRMKDIHEVMRQKQTKYAQLGKQIEMLQQAAEKLREVAPLLAENDDEDNVVLAEVDDASNSGDAMAAKAGASAGSPASSKAARPTAPRWP